MTETQPVDGEEQHDGFNVVEVQRPMNKPKGLEDLDSVESVEDYQGSYADFSAILKRPNEQEVRVHYLKHLRGEWHWKGSHTDEKHDNGHVQFKKKEKPDR